MDIVRDVAFYSVDGRVGTIRFLAPEELKRGYQMKAKVKRELNFYLETERFVHRGKQVDIVGPIKLTFNKEGDIIAPTEYATQSE